MRRSSPGALAGELAALVPEPEPQPVDEDLERIEAIRAECREFLGLPDDAALEAIHGAFRQPGMLQRFWEFFFAHYRVDEETGEETPGPKFQAPLFAKLDALIRSKKPRDEYAVAAPREHGKSVVGLAAVLYAVATLLRYFPCLFSDTDPQALQRLGDVQIELETNERLQAIYPELCKYERSGNEIAFGNGSYFFVAGAGKAILGLRRGKHRPDFILLDDVDRDAVAKNPERMRGRLIWYRKNVRKLGRAAAILVVGTVLHADCLLAQRIGYSTAADGTRVLNPARIHKAIIAYPAELGGLWVEWESVLRDWSIPGGVDGRKAAARAFYDVHREAMDRGAELQWPELFTLYELMEERAEDLATFLSEYQNDPYDPAGCYFSEDVLEWVEPEDMPPLDDVVLSLGGWDPSLGKKKSDSSPFGRLDCFKGGKRIFSEVICGQYAPEEVMQGGIGMHRRRPFYRVIVEKISLSTFYKQLADAALKLGIALPVEAFPAPGEAALNKDQKIKAQRPLCASRTLCFASTLPQPAKDQITQWPQHRHDDVWDLIAELNRAADRLLQGVVAAASSRDADRDSQRLTREEVFGSRRRLPDDGGDLLLQDLSSRFNPDDGRLSDWLSGTRLGD